MMTVYVKTTKGMDELMASRPSIDFALNSVLVIVDGQRNVAQLNALIARAKAPADSLAMLEHGGYIEKRVVPVPVSRTARQQAATPTKPAAPTAEELALRDEATSTFLQTYHFMVSQTKEKLGLRGLGFQFRLERARDLDDLRTLVGPLSEAVAKSQGLQAANAFLRDCDELMDDTRVREAGRRLVEQAKVLQAKRPQLKRVA